MLRKQHGTDGASDRIQALTMDDKNVEFAGCSRTDLLGVFFFCWLEVI